MTSLKSFLARNAIRMSADWADRNPNVVDSEWPGASHWRCVFKRGRKTLTAYFSQGPAISREPTAEDVLDCLAMDASGFKNARDFDDWCGEYGYELPGTDSHGYARRKGRLCPPASHQGC